MDLLALMLIASSILTILGLILAGVVFAPWVVVVCALGLLALLPRLTDEGLGKGANSTPTNQKGKRQPNDASASQPMSPYRAQEASAEQSLEGTARLAPPQLATLRYRGGTYSANPTAETFTPRGTANP